MRILLPLFLWLMLILVLYAIQTHERWMEKTKLEFSVTLQGQPLFNAATMIDGKSFVAGQKIGLGSHVFMVTHPKAEIFATNITIHYGGLNLGNIDLKRAMGVLSLSVNPPADSLVVNGPEWSVTLSNSSGTTNTVPADNYEIKAEYPHWHKDYEASVFAGQTTTFNIAPHFGAIQLDCNQSDVTYRLQGADGQNVAEGTLPSALVRLPTGNYVLVAVHHGHQRTEKLSVKSDTTNDVECDFQYGTVVIETIPTGVLVLTENGQNLGETPLTLAEMQPGYRSYTLQRSGYQSVQLSLDIAANQTNYVGTNLVSESYFHSVSKVHEYLAAADYDRALQAANDALAARPDDIDATILQHEADGLGHLQRAKLLALTNDFVGADKDLALALKSLPDNKEIKALMGSYKPQESAQIERERAERLARPKMAFEENNARVKDAALFESHELTTSKPVKDVVTAIVNALQQGQPPFKVTGSTSPEPEIYTIAANQTDTSILKTTGWRQCLILCGQSSDNETQIYFKVLEYTAKHKVSMPGLLAFKDDLEFVPIHPSRIPDMTDKLKAQVEAGVSNVTVRISAAIQ